MLKQNLSKFRLLPLRTSDYHETMKIVAVGYYRWTVGDCGWWDGLLLNNGLLVDVLLLRLLLLSIVHRHRCSRTVLVNTAT